MPAEAGRALFCTVEAAGQDRPDDAGEAAHGSAPEAADGGRVQTWCDGGANAGATVGNRKWKIEISRAACEFNIKATEFTESEGKRRERRQDGICASCENE